MVRQPWERPWDTPGLPFREDNQRCANHSHCCYRDDDPARCPWCHVTLAHLEITGHAGCLHAQRRRVKDHARRTKSRTRRPRRTVVTVDTTDAL